MFESLNNRHCFDVEEKLIKKKNGRLIKRYFITQRTVNLKAKIAILTFCLFADHWANDALLYIVKAFVFMYNLFPVLFYA